MNPAFRLSGPGEAAAAAGDSVPVSGGAVNSALVYEHLHREQMRQLLLHLDGVIELVKANHTVAAWSELTSVRRELASMAGDDSQPYSPPPEVCEALSKLRVLVQDLPAWKNAGVRLWLGGVRASHLRQLSSIQCSAVVGDLAGVLAALEKGKRS